MKPTGYNIKIIFGLKLKQLRQDRNLSLSELAKRSGLSISYLNEIESGKKYPKTDKIAVLSDALEVTYDKLVSLKLTRNLAPLGDLLESNILEQLPLDHYGIDLNKLIVLMANAPLQLSALVTTLIEMAKSSELSQNNFSRTALRTYKEFNENYFEDLEKAVDNFVKKSRFSNKPPVKYSGLLKLISKQFGFDVDENSLKNYPELSGIRGVFISSEPKRLLINPKLSEPQKAFILGKEIAYQYLGITDRSNMYSASRVDSFDQLLNDFRTSYFSTALMLKKESILKDLKRFLGMRKWDDRKLFELIKKYYVTPEMFLQRFTNLASKFLNLNSYFFLRFNTARNSNEYNLTKELRLNTIENPGGYQSIEHYCRRWVSIWVLKKLEKSGRKAGTIDNPVIGAQISEFKNTGDRYFSISIARKSRTTEGNNSSVTVGFLINDEFKERIRFWNDKNVLVKIVNDTCERCLIKDCKERVANPVAAEKQTKYKNMRTALDKLLNEMQR
ncbi:helix-turn-helix protein [bacterium BMS3Abin03]|nr:helix-turn-helix protein [bacterium BMS3Abin03]